MSLSGQCVCVCLCARNSPVRILLYKSNGSGETKGEDNGAPTSGEVKIAIAKSSSKIGRCLCVAASLSKTIPIFN